MRNPLTWILICSFVAFGCAWKISGEIGYQNGDSISNWRARMDALRDQRTMAQVGVCQWAAIHAGCLGFRK